MGRSSCAAGGVRRRARRDPGSGAAGPGAVHSTRTPLDNSGVRAERHAHQRRCRRWGIPWRVELRVLSNAECAAEGMSSAGSFLQRRSAVLQRRSAVLALMAAAATLLPGLAVAQDVYLRAGIDLSRPADTHFTDADCASLVPAALYGCGLGGDGAPLRSVGNVGTVAGVELGLGYAVAPAVRLEALLTYRSRFTFDGHANFLEPDRQQSVSVDLSSLSGVLAAYVDLPGLGVRSLGPFSPFVGGGLGAARVASGETRMTFPKTQTLLPGTRRTRLTWETDGRPGDVVGRAGDARFRLAVHGCRRHRDRRRPGPGRMARRQRRPGGARSGADPGPVEEPRAAPVSAVRVLILKKLEARRLLPKVMRHTFPLASPGR